jgi:phosphopantothenoylcysteine synthetase/decarboxylase
MKRRLNGIITLSGTWADLMVVAPATANTLSKMANGIVIY